MQSAANGCLRSRLVIVSGISTRNRVQRRIDLGVTTSIAFDPTIYLPLFPAAVSVTELAA